MGISQLLPFQHSIFTGIQILWLSLMGTELVHLKVGIVLIEFTAAWYGIIIQVQEIVGGASKIKDENAKQIQS
jgi:uncharacterized membrane protein